MKRLIFIISIILSVFTLSAREVININNAWRYAKGSSIAGMTTFVDLPHTWNSDINREGGDIYFGTGSYLKEIMVPAKWIEDKRVYLHFKGVSSIATVMINGKYVGTHKGAFTGFTFEITPFLNFGTYNSILVVANNATSMDVMPLGTDMTMYGGIYRDVELIVTGRNHIALSDYGSDGVFLNQISVSRDIAAVEAKVKIDGRIGSQIGVRIDVKDGDNFVATTEATTAIETNGKAEVIMPFSIPNPRLWNGVYDPFMYTTTVTIIDDLGAEDSIVLPLGLRFVSVDRDKGFFLNGEPYKIKGVTKFQDRSGVGSALLRQHHEEDIEMIVDMGATAVRFANAPQDRYVYELCDREGLIVWSDLPFVSDELHGGKGFIDSYDFRNNGENQLTEMIRQNYNSPSVVFLGLFSKISSKGDDPRPYIQTLNDVAHRESPDRLTVGTSTEDGGINFITDVMSWAQYFGWEQGVPTDFNKWSDQFKKDWINLKPGVGEYGAGANIFQQSDSLLKPVVTGGLHPENWQSYIHEQYIPMINSRDFFWGAFANTMFDYANQYNKTGGMNGINDKGLVTWDRHTKKDAYYLYKACWNTLDPFVYITEKRNNQRPHASQNIKVYTNLEEVELFINGVSQGLSKAVNGVVRWNNMRLSKGMNVIEAVSGRTKDATSIEVVSIM